MTFRFCAPRSHRAARCLRRPGAWTSSLFTPAKAIGPICRMRHPHKVARGDPATRIGASGPMGRILSAASPVIHRPELYPLKSEPVIDKPGKGAFYQTDLELMLRNRGIDTLFVAGVTTKVRVNITMREADDRGFRCIVLADCCASYFPEFHAAGSPLSRRRAAFSAR